MTERLPKVVMYTPQWLRTKGGPTTYVRNLAERLTVLGWQVRIVTTDSGEGAESLPSQGWARDLQLFRVLVRESPDVIHIHGRLRAVLPAYLYKRLKKPGTRIVFTFHTSPRYRTYLPQAALDRDYAGLKQRFAHLLLSWCDEVTSVSRNIIRDLQAEFGFRIPRFSIIPSASDLERASDEAILGRRQALGEMNASPLVGTLGVMQWDWKVVGHKIAIETIDVLRSTHPRIRLLIAGDGAYRPDLERAVSEAGLENHVRFLGNIDWVQEFLSMLDLYVHPALNEGCPIAVIEAMRTKVPVVASNRGGIPEILEDGITGLVVEPTSAAFATRIDRLLADPGEMARLAARGREHVEAHHNWSVVANAFVDVYRPRPER